MGRLKKEDIGKRIHRIEIRMNNDEFSMLEKLTKNRGYRTKAQTLREALRHDFIFFLKGREDGYYKK